MNQDSIKGTTFLADNSEQGQKDVRDLRPSHGMEGDRLDPVILPATDILIQPVVHDGTQRNQVNISGEGFCCQHSAQLWVRLTAQERSFP